MRKTILIVGILALLTACSPAGQPVEPTSLPITVPTDLPTEAPLITPTQEILPTDTVSPTDVPPTPEPAISAQLTTEQKLAAQGILDTVCSVCHSPNKVKSVNADQAGWVRIITQMQGKGAAIQDADIQLLAQYLASNP